MKIREDYALSSHSSTSKIHRPPTNAKAHTILDDWIEQALEDGMIINGDAIRSQWIKLCDVMKISEDERGSMSEGWLRGIKARNALSGRKRHVKASSVSSAIAESDSGKNWMVLR